MVSLKCRICAGDLEISESKTLAHCTCCGTQIAIPNNREDGRISAYNFGTYLRRRGEYDKACSVYRKLLQEDWTDAESYWNCALCYYQIQYEKDERTGEYIPNIQKPDSELFTENDDYLDALEHADEESGIRYQEEAAQIVRHQNKLLEERSREPDDIILKRAFYLLSNRKWEEAESCADLLLQKNSKNGMAWFVKLLAQEKCSKPANLKDCEKPFDKTETYQNVIRYTDDTTAASVKRCAQFVNAHTVNTQKKAAYEKACSCLKEASTAEECETAADLFIQLSGYQNAEKMAENCRSKARQLNIIDHYRTGLLLMESEDPGAIEGAVDAFRVSSGYKDADALLQKCLEIIQERNKASDASWKKASKNKGFSVQQILAGIFILIVLCVGAWLFVTRYYIPQKHYDAAQILYEAGERSAAIDAFKELGTFRDSANRVKEIQQEWYAEAESLLSGGDIYHAAFSFGALLDYQDAKERSFSLWNEFADRTRLSAGGHNTVVMFNNGLASSFGQNSEGQCNVGGWMGLAEIDTGWSHSVGLRTDGTAVSAGYNGDKRGAVEKWRNLVSISAGEWHTVALKSDGTVLSAGCDLDGRCDVSDWNEVIALSAGRNHTVGLRADGTVCAVGDNTYGQCDVDSWNDIISISAGGAHTVALRKDGTVIAVGSNAEGQCNVSDWTDIIAVSAGYYHTVGLKSDGTVVAAGWDKFGQCTVDSWSDITTIAAGGWHTAAITEDGLLLCAGMDDYGQCTVPEWLNEEMRNKG